MFALHFGSEEGFLLTAFEEARSWLRRFASILGLQPCEPNGHPRLIFGQRGIIDDEGRLSRVGLNIPYDLTPLPISGWKAYDLRIVKIWSHSQTEDIVYELGERRTSNLELMKMWHALYPVYVRAQRRGGIFLHAGLIGRGGSGVVLAGASNVGKSTCCRRVPAPWRPLCDETALVIPHRQWGYVVHPFPTWSDYLWRRSKRTWRVNEHLSLSAIFFLEQAAVDEVVPIDKVRAVAFITNSAEQGYFKVWTNREFELHRQFKENIFKNACRLAKACPTFILRFSRNGKFWVKIEEALKGV